MIISEVGSLLLGLLLLGLALAGVISIQPRSMIGVSLHWFASWLAQCFSSYLMLACIAVLIWMSLTSAVNVLFISKAVICLFSLGLYLLIFWRGRKTADIAEHVVDRAIAGLDVAGLNATGQSRPPSAHQSFQFDPENKPGLLSRAGLRPFSFGQERVRRLKNVPYGDRGVVHLLDIYLPKDLPPGPLPILIQVPGGAWVTGSKDQQGLPLLNRMAAKGWACFSVNYRLGPKARFPDMLTDVLMAIAWVKAHAVEYGADPGFVAITGGSAGGHLASLAALLQNRAAFQPGFEQADTRVSVVVPIYGRYDFLNRHQILPGNGIIPFLAAKVMPGPPQDCPELWQQASPEAQVHAKAPPFLIVHGSGDTLIPVQEARAFYQALKAVSDQAVDYLELPGAQHAFDMVNSSWSQPTVEAVSRYLNAHFSHYRHQTQD